MSTVDALALAFLAFVGGVVVALEISLVSTKREILAMQRTFELILRATEREALDKEGE